MKTDVLFSSARDDWETPQELFDKLDAEFSFDVDVCANYQNAKCPVFISAEMNALEGSWGKNRCFCNPPYSQIKKWAAKALHEVNSGDAELVVMLIPARTDTAWFHDYVYHRCEIRFIRGRLKFSGSKVNAPFPSMICIYRSPGFREEAGR